MLMDRTATRNAHGATSLWLLSAAALIALWLMMLLFGTGELDHAVLLELYAGHRPLLADAARMITMLGDGRVVTVIAAIAALILLKRRDALGALILFAGTLICRALVEVQKYEINRLRPAENPHLVQVHNLSFPSAHSASSMLVYVAIALFLAQQPRRHRLFLVAAVVLSLLIGLSRVMLGVHWPSDVIGGWSYGAFAALFLYWLAQTLKRKSITSPS
jgi:membrane-associated phospholipid phosphatase